MIFRINEFGDYFFNYLLDYKKPIDAKSLNGWFVSLQSHIFTSERLKLVNVWHVLHILP